MFTKFLTLNILRVSLWIRLEWSFTSNYVYSPFKHFLRPYHRFYLWLSNFRIIYVIYKLKCLGCPWNFLKIQEISHVSNFRGKNRFFQPMELQSTHGLPKKMSYNLNQPFAIWTWFDFRIELQNSRNLSEYFKLFNLKQNKYSLTLEHNIESKLFIINRFVKSWKKKKS